MSQKKDTETDRQKPVPRYAGLFRRLFAIAYDVFLLTAILFIAAAIAMAINHGKPIESSDSFRPLYILVMTGICYLYFSWFWINGGQTLGMKTWRIKLISSKGESIHWQTTAIRFIAAIISWGCFTLGFIWSLFDSKKRSWHDMLSKTELHDLR